MSEGNTLALRPAVHRRYAPKTRTGCLTCKIRRIKCDEAKPFCKRCTSTGRKCDGYAGPKPIEAVPAGPESINAALIVDVQCNALEKRLFDFFRSKTAPGLSGYFRDAVWNRTILQVSHSEPAVRYAINALGALHEETFLRRKARLSPISNAAECRTNFPIKQYTKAISELQKLLRSPDTPIDVILLCSMVFMHFESINESFLPALLHLDNTIQLVRSRASLTNKPIDPGILQTILRGDVQACIYLGMRVPGLPFFSNESESNMPTHFRDLSQARDLVNNWTARLFYFMRTEGDAYRFKEPGNVPLEVIAKAQDLERVSMHLDLLLYDFMQQMSTRLTKREHHGLDMLRSRVKLNRILAGTCVYAEASVNDRYLDVFEEVLMLCEYTMYNGEFDSWLFSVSLDEGLVCPLWSVASNCRDSKIRHRALTLLKKLPAKEGIWFLEVMTQTASACVRYEEAICNKASPLCEDIPEWRRVHSSGLGDWDASSPKTTVNAHLRTRPNGMDGEWCDVQEPIEFWTDTNIKGGDNVFSDNIPILATTPSAGDEPSAFTASMRAESWMGTWPEYWAQARKRLSALQDTSSVMILDRDAGV